MRLDRLDADRLWRVVRDAAAGSRTGPAGEVARLCTSGGTPRLGWVCPAPWEVVRDGVADIRKALGTPRVTVLGTGGWTFAAQALGFEAAADPDACLAVSASGSTLETQELAEKASSVVWLRDEAAPPEAYGLSPVGGRDQVAMLGAPLSMAFLVPASDDPGFEAAYRRLQERHERIGARAARRARAVDVEGAPRMRIASPGWGGEGLRLWLLQLGRQVLCGKSAGFRPSVEVVTTRTEQRVSLMETMYAAGVFVACLALRAGVDVAEHANVRAYKELVATADPDDPAIEPVTDLAGYATGWLSSRPDLRQLHVVHYGGPAPTRFVAATEIHRGSAWNHHSFQAVYADPSIAVLIIVPPDVGLQRRIAVATYQALAGRSRIVRVT